MKKVPFSTLNTSIGDGLNTSAKNGLLNKKKSANGSTSKKANNRNSNSGGGSNDDHEKYSLRFEIKLSTDSSSNGDNCPEFSYLDLVKDAEKKDNNLLNDPDSVYERNEEDRLQKLAKQMEAKYAPKPRKKRRDDYIDKGAGYDENDSFIDNDEAYDELIPSTLTTKYGGFYINCGKLEFRQCSDNEDDEMISEEEDDSRDFLNASKKRKNKISPANSKKRKRVIESDDSKSNDNSRDLDDDEDDESESDDDSIDAESDDGDQHVKSQSLTKKKSNNNARQQQAANPIDSIIESVINQNPNRTDSLNDDSHRIPDDLPSNVKEKLIQLRDMKLDQQDKKQRFFSDEVNKILLSIEMLLTSSSPHRNKVITWLTAYLQVTRETLLKRIKSSKKTSEEAKLKQNVGKLRAEVSYLIVDHEEQYEAKLSKWNQDKRNGLDVGDEPEREFKFNDKIKELLKKVLSSKKMLVELDNIRGKQEEDNITNFFNNEIKNIWPANWVSNRILLKTAGFLSKYSNQSSDANKPSVSVINNKKSHHTKHQDNQANNNQPLNLNTSKPNHQQLSSATSNIVTSNHVTSGSKTTSVSSKQSQQQQPKDLSVEKSNKQHQMDHSKSESLLAKKQQHQSDSKSNSLQTSKLNQQQSDNYKSYINHKIKCFRNDSSPNVNTPTSSIQQQYSLEQLAKLDALNKSANNLQNLNMMQQKINQQMLKEQHKQQITKKLKQQFAQQQFVNTQISKSPQFDSVQNQINNLVAAHSSQTQQQQQSHSNPSPSLNSSANSISRQHSSSNQNSNKKFFEKTQFQQPQSSLNTKQHLNKSPLEVDYKFDKAIQKSLIEESAKQFQQRSNNQSNNNSQLNHQQSLASKSNITPKPAHSNHNAQSSSQAGASGLNLSNLAGLNHSHMLHQQMIVQQILGQFTNKLDAVKYLQQQSANFSGSEIEHSKRK